jgi:hypothetical protein
MMLSREQQALFWSIWAKAEAEVLPVRATRFERETLRHNTIKQACGVTSLKLVNPTTDFDKVMMAVATMANDYDSMSHFCVAGERRTCHMIGECARQIGEIAGEPKGWPYCQALFAQVGLPASWMDIPDHLLFATFKMLDTHRRRMLRRDHGWGGAHKGQPLGFNPTRSYERCGRVLGYRDGPEDRLACIA